jgi:iron-sulfur cluster assembly protein
MITITANAAKQARSMMTENDIDPNNSTYGLRVGVKAGGCSGLNYVLDLVDEPNDNDRVFSQHEVRIFCDPKSYLYLNGTEIDFESNMMGGGFKFTNPNAKRSCGCGTSFAV